jgi:DNA-binding NarL/FixJ family response regulator
MKRTRVLLADDHPLFLEGLQNLLTTRGMEVVGTANDGLQTLAQARATHPDLILMDIQMPRCDGLAATRLIKAELPDIHIVMLTISEDDEHLFEAIQSGASGYLLKSLEAAKFFELLSELTQGEAPLAPGLAARILSEFRRTRSTLAPVDAPASDESTGLTPRQIEVLTLVARGFTYKEIGAALCVSERTVKYHMGEILKRLHLENRSQAIAYASGAGLAGIIEQPQPFED